MQDQGEMDDPQYNDLMLVDHNIVLQWDVTHEDDNGEVEHGQDGAGTSSTLLQVRDAIPF